MPVVAVKANELTQLDIIENAIGTYEEYSQLVESDNDKLCMCLKTMKAHVQETNQFTKDEVEAAKREALIQVGAERKFCVQLANSPLPDNSVQAKQLLPDIENAIHAISI